MNKLPSQLRENVRLLGDLLGESILTHNGRALFDKIEEIRGLSKALHETDRQGADYEALMTALGTLNDQDILPVARAFGQFLNLVNIADQEFFYGPLADQEDSLATYLEALSSSENPQSVYRLLTELRIELVLTAHPTESLRRTLIHKYDRVASALSDRRRGDLLPYEADQVRARLHRLVEEIWQTDEIRATKPSAVDEAKWGFAVVENSLWRSVGDVLRHVDRLCQRHWGKGLPLEASPLRFFSWMGGDRDGNPNVTSEISRQVLLLGRWKAADLCLRDVQALMDDLSMHAADAELESELPAQSEMPYRDILRQLRDRLRATLAWSESSLQAEYQPEPADVIHCKGDLLAPLLLCHRSLEAGGLHHVSQGPLTDLIRRIHAFGINLLPLDIRQGSERHVALFSELTRYLELGDYLEWSEAERQDFLLKQLQSKRPLLPRGWKPTEESAELLRCCEMIAAQPAELLSHYVISMTRQASDVLATALLLRECGVGWNMPIAPLFETLDDLERAPRVMQQLWALPWYRGYVGAQQTVMIGYSDSAKDAGKFAATWALYKCQESLVSLARESAVGLYLFHGRGGSIGRGGGPVEKALASQPPGSVAGGIRVTEQGEMIRYKYGLPRVAFASLNGYLQATLQATLSPAPAAQPQWRRLMEDMAQVSVGAYRAVVRENEDFLDYFRSLTPEQELSKLALGSRPARRQTGGGVESLRAIPWVFAWTQVRLNLPGWLGVRQALDEGLEQNPNLLRDMAANWPFFASFIDLLEMLLGKADAGICSHYEQQLVDPVLHALGYRLREDLKELIRQVSALKQQDGLLDGAPVLQQSFALRKPYIDPLNYLQAELLKRERQSGKMSEELELALKVTMNGIAAGMRNTG